MVEPSLPEPAWRRPARGRAQPRQPLTRDPILEAATRVLDRDGVDALSMHAVARELGTGAASLYWHVRNKDELLQLLSERLGEDLAHLGTRSVRRCPGHDHRRCGDRAMGQGIERLYTIFLFLLTWACLGGLL